MERALQKLQSPLVSQWYKLSLPQHSYCKDSAIS